MKPTPPSVEGGDPVFIEGYLSKFSSGTLTCRWQKRYFVLRESGLEYFGKEAHARASLAGSSVMFPIRRLRSVSPGQSNKEFDLVIGAKKRKYSLKASSADLCTQWITELEKVIAAHTNAAGSTAGSAESVASDPEGSDFLGGSSLNDNSSSGAGLATSETLWEHPDVSGEELDALFSEWFVFLEDSRIECKAGRIIDAGSRAVSDMWAVIAHLPRGENIEFEEARLKILEQTSKLNEIESVVAEYIARLSGKISLWVNKASNSIDDIPVVIEWVSRLERNVASIFPPSTSGLKQLIRMLASEWEVALIELLNAGMASELVWDLPEVHSAGKLSTRPHGPAKVLVPFGAPGKPVLTTSWTLEYVDVVTERCLGRKSARGTLWSVAYPTCAKVLTTHASSALVASLNACWRQVKKRASAMVSYKSSSAMGSVMNRMKRMTVRKSSVGELNRELSNMIAFGNEATLLSIFCQHASADTGFSSASPAFVACLEGLSSNFASTANEAAKAIVKTHLLKRNHKIIMAAFDPKHLAVRVKVPISETLEVAKAFIESLPETGCHDLLKYLIIGQVMQGVANSYITSLVRHRPKLSKFTRLGAVVAEDEALFFSMFRDLGRVPTEINSAIDQISHTRAVLSEPVTSKTDLHLVQECVELTKAFPSSQRAIEVVKALLEIKGIAKQDRKDIVYSVSECVQRNINSPSPMLDLSKEEEDDEEVPDDSGFSSLHSGKNGDESP